MKSGPVSVPFYSGHGIPAVSCPWARDTERHSLSLFPPACFDTAGNWCPALFIETSFVFFLMNQFQCEFRIRADYLPSHCRHAYQTTFPSCLWGNRGPKWAKLSHIESWLCQQAQRAHAQRKYAAQYFYYSPCQAGALVTQDNRRFVGCSSRRFIPEFTICLAEMWLWGGGTTLTQHLTTATVALVSICILLLCKLADFCMMTSWNVLCTSTATVATRASQDAKGSLFSCVQKSKSVHLQACWCLLLSVCTDKPLWADSSIAH